MKNNITITSGLNGDDFVKDKKTYIVQIGSKKIFFTFGNSWNPDLFKKLLRFKINRHFTEI